MYLVLPYPKGAGDDGDDEAGRRTGAALCTHTTYTYGKSSCFAEFVVQVLAIFCARPCTNTYIFFLYVWQGVGLRAQMPKYYAANDLYVGATVTVHHQKFKLYKCDLFTLQVRLGLSH